jgi:hypothetical protein
VQTLGQVEQMRSTNRTPAMSYCSNYHTTGSNHVRDICVCLRVFVVGFVLHFPVTSLESENMAVGILCAENVAPSVHKSWHYLCRHATVALDAKYLWHSHCNH